MDVCEFLTHEHSPALDVAAWRREWGVADLTEAPGGLTQPRSGAQPPHRYLLQRKTTPIGRGLGKTTGWVHRASLTAKKVQLLTGVTYERIDDEGLHITVPMPPERAAAERARASEGGTAALVARAKSGGRTAVRRVRATAGQVTSVAAVSAQAAGQLGGLGLSRLPAPARSRAETGIERAASVASTMTSAVEGLRGLAGLGPREIAIPREPRVLDVDTIVICAGQESVRDLVEPLRKTAIRVHVIGGADVAAELDAKRAIDQAVRLAAKL